MKNALVAFLTFGIAVAFTPPVKTYDDNQHHALHRHHGE